MTQEIDIDGINRMARLLAERSAASVAELWKGPKERVHIHSTLGPGDTLGPGTMVVESLARQFPLRYEIMFTGTAADFFENNPHISAFPLEHAKQINFGTPAEYSNTHQGHMAQWSCRQIGEQLGVDLMCQVARPMIYLTPEEKQTRLLDTPYALIKPDWHHTGQMKFYSYWQEVIDLVRAEYPWLTIVQVGQKVDFYPLLKGALDMRDRWNSRPRAIVVAAYNSEFGLCPAGWIAHAYAAAGKPAVCVMTGNEPLTWSYYPGIKYVGRHGTLPCCQSGGCWRGYWDKCLNLKAPQLPLCMDIPPQEVVEAVKQLDNGGLIRRKIVPLPVIAPPRLPTPRKQLQTCSFLGQRVNPEEICCGAQAIFECHHKKKMVNCGTHSRLALVTVADCAACPLHSGKVGLQ